MVNLDIAFIIFNYYKWNIRPNNWYSNLLLITNYIGPKKLKYNHTGRSISVRRIFKLSCYGIVTEGFVYIHVVEIIHYLMFRLVLFDCKSNV